MDKCYNNIIKNTDFKNIYECSSGYMDSDNCSWYHHNWILLRKLGMVSNPFWHEKFYKNCIKNYIDYNAKCLVLGTADFSMPLLCYESRIKNLDICDKCQTPLNICNAVSQKQNILWSTYQGDIFSGLEKKYDVIINDAFMTRFDYSKKRIVLQKIADGLNKNGVYITTMRKGWNNGQAVVPMQIEKDGFINRAIDMAKEFNVDLQIAKKSATEYINKMVSYPIKDEHTLKKLVQGIFEIKYCNVADVKGECLPTSYFQLVLSKI